MNVVAIPTPTFNEVHVQFLCQHLIDLELENSNTNEIGYVARFLILLANAPIDGELFWNVYARMNWTKISCIYTATTRTRKYLNAMDFGKYSIIAIRGETKIKISEKVRVWVLKMQKLAEVQAA